MDTKQALQYVLCDYPDSRRTEAARHLIDKIVTVEASLGGGNRLLAGNLPADMAQLANVVVSDGLLQSWTANGIDYVATYSDGKVATVTASDGWVQTYTWVGDVPTITVAEV